MAAIQLKLVDINPQMITAWRTTFADCPEIQIIPGSMTKQQVSAWVSPTNSGGAMNGGLDLAIRRVLGRQVEARVQKAISRAHQGAMPVGYATCVESGHKIPRFLISTPTMVTSSEDISATMNVVLACSAAIQAARMQNHKQSGSITTLAIPGLGAATGRVPVHACAELMRLAVDLMRDNTFESFGAMRAALRETFGEFSVAGSADSRMPQSVLDDLESHGKAIWSGWYA